MVDFSWTLIIGMIIALGIALWSWHRGETKPGNVTQLASEFMQASQVAQDVVAAGEQLWISGQIPADGRLDYAMKRLHDLFPGLTEGQLRAVVESAVYFLKMGMGRVSSNVNWNS